MWDVRTCERAKGGTWQRQFAEVAAIAAIAGKFDILDVQWILNN
jgi:hypothetical protein